MGAEVAIGGWLPTFLLSTRNASPFAAGMALVGFWLGVVLGTVLLGLLTAKIGERSGVSAYLALALALQVVVWLVPSFWAAVIASAFVGFCMGPVFPTAIVVAVKLLPDTLHVTAMGIISSAGCAGSAVFPFAFGAIAQRTGVKVMPPFVLSLLGAILVVWLLLPRLPFKTGERGVDLEMSDAQKT